ncbi:MAG: 16S rRNA (guanine(527)-N(7))-methyltransferase RsmG [Clostridiales bacterium]|jgi:16S rRNA (guanine527-N7)-methyltransferase|nr:16S rRNA (guanine(527)-N(7))-methyltransferase RsmG [Clostridiales bacterium]
MEQTDRVKLLIIKYQASFELYCKLLQQHNVLYNLTSITERNQIFLKHFEDSLLGENLIAENASILDIGCGAGFPSIPIALVREDLTATLLDSVNKKISFVKLVIEQLALSSRVNAQHIRVEDCKMRESFDCVLTRAVAKLNTLVELSLPFVKVGGVMLAYKSNDIESELKQSMQAISELGGQLKSVVRCPLQSDIQRKIVVIQKIAVSNIKYPRGKNLPRVKPL